MILAVGATMLAISALGWLLAIRLEVISEARKPAFAALGLAGFVATFSAAVVTTVGSSEFNTVERVLAPPLFGAAIPGIIVLGYVPVVWLLDHSPLGKVYLYGLDYLPIVREQVRRPPARWFFALFLPREALDDE